MPKLLLSLMGPTGAGKSELALALAEAEGWEIVSVDSRQVFRRVDIGTAKPSVEDRRRVPHHMIDVAEVDEKYDGHRYAREATEALAEIEARGRHALLVGGTGLYWQALVAGGFHGPPGDEALREDLRREAARQPPGWLHEELRKVDPVSARRLHPHDTFRLVRALEITRLTGRPASQTRPGLGGKARLIILSRPREELYQRIARRWELMARQGIREEVDALLKEGYAPDLPSLRSVGYRQVVAHLQGKLTWAEASAEAIQSTRRYAKRQLTWFRQAPGAEWIEVTGDMGQGEAEEVRRLLLQ